MAQNINSVTLTGNLTRDPELRHTPSGVAVCSMRIAVNMREKVNGEWTDRGNFFDVIVWGNQGDACAQYLAKGRPLAVQGKLRWREWETQEGSKRQTVEIVADRVQFLGSKDDGGGGQSSYREDYGGMGEETYGGGTGESYGAGTDASDVPFDGNQTAEHAAAGATGSDDDIPF